MNKAEASIKLSNKIDKKMENVTEMMMKPREERSEDFKAVLRDRIAQVKELEAQWEALYGGQ